MKTIWDKEEVNKGIIIEITVPCNCNASANNNMIIPLDHIQQQLDSVKTEWVDFKTSRDNAQK